MMSKSIIKKLLLSITFVLGLTAHSQSLQKEFESKKWYVSGTFFNQEPLFFKSEKNKDQDADVELLKGRMVKWHGITRESSFDEQGNEIGPGIEYTDTTFTYTFKNNMVKMMRFVPADKNNAEIKFYVYYKIEALEEKKSYKLSHITYEEFNK